MSRILIVDNYQSVAYLLKRTLDEYGHTCVCVHSPLDALNLNQEFDLLITEFYLPEMCGEVFVHKYLEKHPNTRVIYLSVYSCKSKLSNCIEKPFSILELISIVKSTLLEIV